MLPSNKKGFSLIELLVVISITAILSIIGLVSYTSFLKSSRDNKRLADLKFIQSALEQYHIDKLAYPFAVIPGKPLASGTKIYMTKVPKDQIADPDYSYVPSGNDCVALTPENCNSYCLYAKFEGKNIPASDGSCTPSPSSLYNYGITRP